MCDQNREWWIIGTGGLGRTSRSRRIMKFIRFWCLCGTFYKSKKIARTLRSHRIYYPVGLRSFKHRDDSPPCGRLFVSRLRIPQIRIQTDRSTTSSGRARHRRHEETLPRVIDVLGQCLFMPAGGIARRHWLGHDWFESTRAGEVG